MDKTKDAIKTFMSKSGKHDTTIHEKVNPSVKHETVKPTQHEEVNTAIDREVHQDHYHHTVQPVLDKEILPEQHHHKLGSVEHREFDHRNQESTKQKLAVEGQKFKDERVVLDVKHSQSHAPTVHGEHVHHHLHETIQPVVHKETIQPHVVHTTVPIHEIHHNAAQHHSTTELPPVSMTEYKKTGGVLSGREERFDAFEGESTHINGHMMSNNRKNGVNHDKAPNGAHHGDLNNLHSGTTGVNGVNKVNGVTNGNGVKNVNGATNGHVTATTTGERKMSKPSLLNKLNPKTDADGDGVAGFMK